MRKKTIVVIGLGLMGGSIALALKKKSKSFRIFGISRSQKKIQEAVRKRIIDQGSTFLKDIPVNTELILIATPVPKIVPTVRALDQIVKKTVLVTDVGSTKQQILDQLKKARLQNVKFVGSHPMAGDHETGLEFARADLYEDSLVFVTRDSASPAALKKIEFFWRSLGANRLVTLSARDHDRIVAEVSHLPHLVASALTLCSRSEHLLLSGPGFKDATRIAQGDPDLWAGIISSNQFIVSNLRKFEIQIKKIRSLIQKKEWSRLRRLLEGSALRRRSINAA